MQKSLSKHQMSLIGFLDVCENMESPSHHPSHQPNHSQWQDRVTPAHSQIFPWHHVHFTQTPRAKSFHGMKITLSGSFGLTLTNSIYHVITDSLTCSIFFVTTAGLNKAEKCVFRRGSKVSNSCKDRHAKARLRVVIVLSPRATAPASTKSLEKNGQYKISTIS